MTSWKTTVSAILAAFSSFVIFSQELHYITWPQWALGLAMFTSIGGLAALGVSAKDYNVTGGDTRSGLSVLPLKTNTTAVIKQEGAPPTVVHTTQETKEVE